MSGSESPPQRKHRHQELFTQVQFVKGVGPDRAQLLNKLRIFQVIDILFFFPRRYEDFSSLSTPQQIHTDVNTSVIARVVDVDANFTRAGKQVTSALVEVLGRSPQAVALPVYLVVTWFNLDFLSKKLAREQTVMLQGVIKVDEDRWVMTQPKISWTSQMELPEQVTLLPVYPLTEGLSQDRIRQIVKATVEEYVGLLEEVFPTPFLQAHDLLGIQQGVMQIHLPETQADVDEAQRRLIFQELFVQQTALAMRRKHLETQHSAPCIELTPVIKSRILNRFPFELTTSQHQAIEEIAADMKQTIPMNRLLHGEVGSGKTAVATFAILLAVAQGFQAAVMAPTEILVEQHVQNLKRWLAGSRVEIESWTGSMTDRQRLITSTRIREGKTSILIGTHALANADLEFEKLGLVVIDEQHKFGVRQRSQFRSVGGTDPHYLVMTATPIPRTISMTLYGDLDVSMLQSRINATCNVHTYFGSESQRAQWWEFFRKKLDEGRQGYVIAPLVDAESESLASVEGLYESLTNGPLEAYRVDLLHGRLKSAEKLQIMHAFARGHTQVLVATSVIEVGVDVANATVMTIESAERFGLSQLHQLRGRIARGQFPGFVCAFPSPQVILNDPEGVTERRLQAFVDSADGFELAEIDLQLRGPGDFFSDKQHGFPPMRIADLSRDQKPLYEARKVAREIVAADPQLENADFSRLRRMVIARYGKALELSDVG